MKAFGFSTSIAWVVGVSCREETTGSLKPLAGRTTRGPPGRRQDTTAGFCDGFRPGSGPIHCGPQTSAGEVILLSVKGIPASSGAKHHDSPRFCSFHVLYLSLTIRLTYSLSCGRA